MTLFSGLPELRKPTRPLSIDDFIEGEDREARIPDWRLAEVLDFTFEPEIRRLIDRHRESLEQFGTLCHGNIKSTGGRPGSEYRLNFNQAIFVIIRSEAPNAVPVQIHVVTIYGLWATGKLRPVDPATETKIAAETSRTFQQAPELMGLLQGLLERVGDLATQTEVGEVGSRIASLQRTALEIQDRLGHIVKRRDAPIRNQDIYDLVVVEFYLGRCPCCQRPDRILIRDGQRTRLYRLDHISDNPYKNGLHEMWAVCEYCNSKFKNDQRYRAETMDQFRVFQSRVADVTGQRLI